MEFFVRISIKTPLGIRQVGRRETFGLGWTASKIRKTTHFQHTRPIYSECHRCVHAETQDQFDAEVQCKRVPKVRKHSSLFILEKSECERNRVKSL